MMMMLLMKRTKKKKAKKKGVRRWPSAGKGKGNGISKYLFIRIRLGLLAECRDEMRISRSNERIR